jgi:hypothetical protein
LHYTKWISLIIIILVIIPTASASTNVEVGSDTYDLLLRLEAEGVIQSGLLTTRPLSRKEAIRLILEAERNSEDKSLFIRQIIKSLKERFKDEIAPPKFIKPLEVIYSSDVYSDNSGDLTYNSNGDSYEKGSNLRLGFSSRAEWDWLYLYVHPEIRHSDSDTDMIMKKAYGILNFFGLDLTFGKDSQWWGPGYHGAILLSNNPESLTILKLNNSQPVILPSVLKHLGLFKFTIFTTRLGAERKIPNPYLWGMRFNFKPAPYIELGLQRTAILGGEGRSENYNTWWESFTGKGENKPGEAGDQRAGLDLKLTLPFARQPLQLYAEAAGEDEAGGLPSHWAYLTGMYLPRILNLERLDFRVEFATTHVNGHPNVWYSHHIYTGYTFKGKIIGHHMGTDSRDIFLEARYFLPKMNNGRIAVSYDMEKHNLSGEIKETIDEFAIKINLPVKKAITLKTAYSYGKIKNLDNIQRANKNINILMAEIMYRF